MYADTPRINSGERNTERGASFTEFPVRSMDLTSDRGEGGGRRKRKKKYKTTVCQALQLFLV